MITLDKVLIYTKKTKFLTYYLVNEGISCERKYLSDNKHTLIDNVSFNIKPMTRNYLCRFLCHLSSFLFNMGNIRVKTLLNE